MSKPGPLTGRAIGNYLVADILDEGGMGSVYLAEHRFLGEKAAVKVLHRQPAQVDMEELARRFFQEARATRSIDHPNVVKVMDFGQTDDGMLYLAMELLEGVTIAEVLRRSPKIEERTAAFIAAAVASGLNAAHEKGIIHRDLKPANIFLSATGRVKLLDFGMAKVKEGRLRTGVGVIVGTPQYISPEQIRQEQVGPKADIYGLGAVLFRMLTGRLPFPSDSLQEIVKAHLFTPAPRPSELAKVSTEMDAIVLSCMEKDPAQRPGSMLELWERLRPIAEQLGPSAAAGMAGQDRGETAPRPEISSGLRELARVGAQPLPVETKPAPAKSGIGKVLVLLVVAAALVAGAAIAKPWTYLNPPHAPPPTPPAAAPNAPSTETAKAPAEAVKPPPTKFSADEFTQIHIESDPEGARVFVDHELQGDAPLDLAVPIPCEIKLTLDGYKTVRKKITKAGPVHIKLVPDSSALPRPPPDEPGKLPPDAP